jgi:hypothetical protein
MRHHATSVVVTSSINLNEEKMRESTVTSFGISVFNTLKPGMSPSIDWRKTIHSGLKKRVRSRDLYNCFVVSVPTQQPSLRVCQNGPISLISFLELFSHSVADKKIEENNKFAMMEVYQMKINLSESLPKFSNHCSRQSISKRKLNSKKNFKPN